MSAIKYMILIQMFMAAIGFNNVLEKETEYLDGGLLVDGRTLVPMRTIFESMGADVQWNSKDQSINASKDDLKIFMKVNEPEVKVNEKTLILDVPPKIRNGKTMVPLRFVGEVFGGEVKWEGKTSTAIIITNKKEIIVSVEPDVVSITISAAGDVTLGGDDRYGNHGSFNQEAKNSGLDHFVENIKDIFSADDLTMVNLEGALTNATKRADKKFTFRGDPSYTEILTRGNIDAVNLANNHTFDYFQKGYDDTINYLKNAGVGYFGNKNHYITEIKDVKIGMLGYNGWNDSITIRNQINKDIETLRDQGVKIVIVNFHWGQERSYVPNQTQKSLGRYTIDSGADLVVGHHPHVVQGIEEYKDKFIVYSLGNFMFGGNRNPSDKDTFVFQQTFQIESGKLTNKKEINVIPFSISSVSHRNNFQPTPLTGSAAETLKQKIIRLSNEISDTNWVQYEN